MTDPTPTRAEVERLRLIYGNITASPSGPYVRFSDYQALRERAEAAEAENQRTNQLWEHTSFMLGATLADLSAARRAEAAAWNDAIEAADKAAIALQGRQGMGDGRGNYCYDIGVSDAASAIRALRRAAPTEGEA